MSSAHYAALKALFPAGLKVFTGSAPDLPAVNDYPYAVIGGDLGDQSGESLGGDNDRLDLHARVTYAGLSFDAVLITSARVRSALTGRRLIVPGWSCGPIRQAAVANIQTDFDLTVPGTKLHPVFAVDEFTVVSTR